MMRRALLEIFKKSGWLGMAVEFSTRRGVRSQESGVRRNSIVV
jgi:hypothetical protein